MAAPKKKPSIIFDEKPGRFTAAGQQGPKQPAPKKAAAPKPPKPNAPQDAKKIWDTQARKGAKPKASPITFEDKPKGPSTRFQDAQKQGATLRNPPKAAPNSTPKIAAKAAGIGSKIAKGLSVGSKLLGRANPIIGQITSAKSTNDGEAEWLKDKGPLMRGSATKTTPRKPAPGFNPSGVKSPVASRKPAPGTNYNPSLPAATGSESAGAPRKPAPSSNYSPPSAPQSSVSPNVGTSKMQGESKQRGGVKTLQTRFQRDSGLAMDQRKRK